MKFGFSLALLLATSLLSLSAFGEGEGHDHGAGHDQAAEHAAGHEAGHSDEAGHGDAHGHGHVPHFSDINWMYGMLGEKEGVEPSLLWRSPGMPIPLFALLLNTAILFFLIGRFGGPGIKQGLVDRKQRIAGDIEKAAKMKAEAEDQLAHYEEKLEKMEAEMTRIKNEMQEQAEADRQRIIADAKERRAVMEAEAKLLIEQELAQARQDAVLKAVSGAVAAAREQVIKNMNAQDQERLATDFLGSLEAQVKKSTGAVS
jgi:F-type H+-transporting ATPase subunit b